MNKKLVHFLLCTVITLIYSSSEVFKPSDKGGFFISSKPLVKLNGVQLKYEQIVNKFG